MRERKQLDAIGALAAAMILLGLVGCRSVPTATSPPGSLPPMGMARQRAIAQKDREVDQRQVEEQLRQQVEEESARRAAGGGLDQIAAFIRAIDAFAQVDPAAAQQRLCEEIDRTGSLALALAAGDRAPGKLEEILQRRQAEAQAAATPQERAERYLEVAAACLQVGQRDRAADALRSVYQAIQEGRGQWRAGALEAMTGHLASLDVHKALRFVLALKVRSPELKPRLFAQVAPYWQARTASSLERYLKRLRKSGARLDDGGYVQIIKGVAAAQPRLALRLVPRIRQAELRYQALGEVLVQEAKSEPEQARALLQRVRDPGARTLLEQKLQQAQGG